jgi:hypothetical protein
MTTPALPENHALAPRRREVGLVLRLPLAVVLVPCLLGTLLNPHPPTLPPPTTMVSPFSSKHFFRSRSSSSSRSRSPDRKKRSRRSPSSRFIFLLPIVAIHSFSNCQPNFLLLLEFMPICRKFSLCYYQSVSSSKGQEPLPFAVSRSQHNPDHQVTSHRCFQHSFSKFIYFIKIILFSSLSSSFLPPFSLLFLTCFLSSRLTRNVTADHLREIFGQFGKISSVDRCLTKPSNIPKTFAYVSFEFREEAEAALEAYNGVCVEDGIIRLRKS